MKVATLLDRTNPIFPASRRWPLGLAALIACTLSLLYIGRISQAASTLLVKISIEGEEKIVATDATTVGDVLDKEGIVLDRLDLVEPNQSTPLSDAFNINIYRARPVMVIDGGKRTTITTALRSSHLVAKAAGLVVYPEDRFEETLVKDFVEEGFIGEQIILTRAKAVTVRADGNDLELRTHAGQLSELFAEKGIVLEGSDFASLPLNTPVTDGLDVRITRVGSEVVVEKQEVPFKTRTIKNFDLPYGEEEIEEAGKPGQVVLSYRVIHHNDEIVSRRLLSKTVVSQPQDRVVVKGMKPVTAYTTNNQILAALRQCETGGNYTTNTGNGYYGAYQFLRSTWDRIARRYRPSLVGVSPHQAKPADQDYLVLQNARASAGGFQSQHPGCYYKLGLPKFPL